MDIASLLNSKSVTDEKMARNLETGKQKKDDADRKFKQGDTTEGKQRHCHEVYPNSFNIS